MRRWKSPYARGREEEGIGEHAYADYTTYFPKHPSLQPHDSLQKKKKKKRKKRERKRALLVGFISQYLLLQPGCFQPQNGGTYALSWTQGWGGAYLYSALLCKEARYPNGQEHGLWSQNPSSDTYYQYGLGQVNFSSPQFANLQGGARLSTKASHVL